jgi:hypothetical protein
MVDNYKLKNQAMAMVKEAFNNAVENRKPIDGTLSMVDDFMRIRTACCGADRMILNEFAMQVMGSKYWYFDKQLIAYIDKTAVEKKLIE